MKIFMDAAYVIIQYPSHDALLHLSAGNRESNGDRTVEFNPRPEGCSVGSGSSSNCSTITTRPNAAFFVYDQEGQVIGTGEGSMTGLTGGDVISRRFAKCWGSMDRPGDLADGSRHKR